ncbi:MAG: dihydroorotate dehydrogenase-like protein [Vicinamibacterales bacterium]
MNMHTRYLGLSLPHPFVCGASPLSADLDMALRLEDAGAAAIVMHSLFEEQILKDARRRTQPQDRRVGAYALSAGAYLEHLLRLKQRVGIPIIASLNGVDPDGWLQYARALERAGADALELNFYHVATDPAEDGRAVEQRVLDVVAVVKESVRLPLAVKLAPFYSSLPNMAARLDHMGVDGLVLFNRFYQADIDPETRGTSVDLHLSGSADLLQRLHAVASLSGRVGMSLAISGGVHDPVDAVKGVMAGAHVVQLVSALLRHGPKHLTFLRTMFEAWCDGHEYESLDALRGVASLATRDHAAERERNDYVSVLQSWSLSRLSATEGISEARPTTEGVSTSRHAVNGGRDEVRNERFVVEHCSLPCAASVRGWEGRSRSGASRREESLRTLGRRLRYRRGG